MFCYFSIYISRLPSENLTVESMEKFIKLEGVLATIIRKNMLKNVAQLAKISLPAK